MADSTGIKLGDTVQNDTEEIGRALGVIEIQKGAIRQKDEEQKAARAAHVERINQVTVLPTEFSNFDAFKAYLEGMNLPELTLGVSA
ncbi:hypothetical protein IPG41_00695 [Candidatus Peregrinibacteria bacterium]|nr:MAG: hypothetical protein IPG41_00695 [Candidatus Peregrinibacteria bacterium]